MRRFVRGLAVATAAIAVLAAPAWAVDERKVAPDGRSMASSTATSHDAADGDGLSDVYSWNRGVFGLASGGPGSDPVGAFSRFISDDGTRVVFTTRDPLVAADTDTAVDLYERAGGTTTLVSTGPADAGAPDDAEFAGASEDGTRLLFETFAPLVAADTDSNRDIYMRSGGTTTLVSTTPAGVADGHHEVVAVSRNGERVVEMTGERLTSDDTDSDDDLYERFGGSTTLVSKGSVEDSAASSMFPLDVTPDAKSVVVLTPERYVSADDNEDWDLYQFSRGRTTLVTSRSDGSTPECPRTLPQKLGLEPPPGRRPPCEPFVFGQTDTGSKVLFLSPKPLDSPPGTLLEPNEDTTGGLFEKSSDGTTRLIDEQAFGAGHAIAADGSRYVVQTQAQRSAADNDDDLDIYLVDGGAWTLLTGASDSDIVHDVVEVSTDARRVFFSTHDHLVPEDTNDDANLYVNTDAGPRLAMTGPADPDPDWSNAFVGASALGDRWFFRTARALVTEDTDTAYDFYLRHLDGTTRLLSP